MKKLAELYDNNGYYEKSIVLYKYILELMPNNIDIMNSLGKLYHLRCDINESIIYYNEIFKINKTNTYIMEILGNLNREIGD